MRRADTARIHPPPPELTAQDGVAFGREDIPQELLHAAKERDPEAWTRLYELLYEDVLRQITFLVGGDPAVDDLVQEAFVRAYAGADAFRAEARFSTWLSRIALNVVRRHWRSTRSRERRHEHLRLTLDAARPADLESAHQDAVQAHILVSVLETLPEDLRAAFVLRDLQEVSPADAAAQLGISEGNLAVRAHRARRRVRDVLERLGWIAPSGEGT